MSGKITNQGASQIVLVKSNIGRCSPLSKKRILDAATTMTQTFFTNLNCLICGKTAYHIQWMVTVMKSHAPSAASI